jgi:hypothetical protein
VQVACVQEPGKMILRLSLAGSRVGNETLGRSGKSAGYRIAIGAYSEAIRLGPNDTDFYDGLGSTVLLRTPKLSLLPPISSSGLQRAKLAQLISASQQA